MVCYTEIQDKGILMRYIPGTYFSASTDSTIEILEYLGQTIRTTYVGGTSVTFGSSLSVTSGPTYTAHHEYRVGRRMSDGTMYQDICTEDYLNTLLRVRKNTKPEWL